MHNQAPSNPPRPITEEERRATEHDSFEQYMSEVRGDDEWWDRNSYIEAQLDYVDDDPCATDEVAERLIANPK